jgi:hypothetical protein
MIRKSEVTEFINLKKRTMRQKQVLYLWFIEVWGFNFDKELLPPYLFNNSESSAELEFRILLILA